MMNFLGLRQGRRVRLANEGAALPAPSDVLWIDLLDPNHEEEKAVEALLGLQVPTRQEMAEIEESARLYQERDALVMTAAVINGVAEGRVERAADVLEMVAADLNEVSTRLFIEDRDPKRRRAKRVEDELQVLIKRLGRKNMTVAILRESLLSLSRLVPYLRQGAEEWLTNGSPARLKQVERDLRSLSAYERQLSSEIVYLHDATLGLINLDQTASSRCSQLPLCCSCRRPW